MTLESLNGDLSLIIETIYTNNDKLEYVTKQVSGASSVTGGDSVEKSPANLLEEFQNKVTSIFQLLSVQDATINRLSSGVFEPRSQEVKEAPIALYNNSGEVYANKGQTNTNRWL